MARHCTDYMPVGQTYNTVELNSNIVMWGTLPKRNNFKFWHLVALTEKFILIFADWLKSTYHQCIRDTDIIQ